VNVEEPFGKRLPAILVETADLPNSAFIDYLEKKLSDFWGFRQLDDDYTLLAIHLE
jgi:hypothetical protein